MARKSRKHTSHDAPEVVQALKYTAWGYARISNDGERSEDSIESQTAIIQDFVSDKSDIDLQNVVTDIGFSGTDFLRPGYAELVAGIECGEVKCIIVKDLSRVGRTYIEVGEFLFDTLPSYNVRFISVNDDYDSFADDAARKKLLILFKNLVNHMYSKDLSVKIRASFATMHQNGHSAGGKSPYGYLYARENGKKRLIIEPESAKVVKMIFDMRQKGDSCLKISDYLNLNDIPSPRNHYYNLGLNTNPKYAKKIFWDDSGIGVILRNESYTGNRVHGRYSRNGRQVSEKPHDEWVIHENTHQAIVEKSQFGAVQELLNATSVRYKSTGRVYPENIFVGKIFCSRCEKGLVRKYYETVREGLKFSYFCRRCSMELKQTMGFERIKKTRPEKLEEILTTVLQNQIDVCANIDEIVAEASKKGVIVAKHNSLKSEHNRLRRESKKADDMLASAFTHHLAGLIDIHELNLVREKFERDKHSADTRAEIIAKEIAGFDAEKIKNNSFLVNFRHFKGFEKLDRALVETLIRRIDVSPETDEIHVTLNFMDELGELNKLIAESGVMDDVS